MKKQPILVLIFNLILIVLCSCNTLNERPAVETPEAVTTDGELTRTCTGCGEIVTEVIPAVGEHSWNEGEVTLEPTMAAEGVQ